MKKVSAFIFGLIGILVLSCDEDDPVVPKLSFVKSEMTVNEGDGTIEVEIVLDQAHSRDLQVKYSVAGTAKDKHTASAAEADFQIRGAHGVANIPAGSTSGAVVIDLIDDDRFEEDETIILRLDPGNEGVVIGGTSEITITIVNDDALIVASFVEATMTVNEDDEFKGLIQVAVQLDKPAPSDLTIEYTVGGTALDSLTGHQEEYPAMYYDYHVHGELGKLTVPAGHTSANIDILVYTDLVFELDETIELTLTKSASVDVGTIDKMTIELLQQNGKAIALWWDDGTTDVDMDLFLWLGVDAESLTPFAFSLTPSVELKEEVVFLPKIITDEIVEATFGLSYNYYTGTADPLDFEVHFIDFTDGVIAPVEDRDVFTAQYTKANIFPWDVKGQLPAVVQTFKVVNGAYLDFSEITVPATGSRMKSVPVTPEIRKQGHIPRSLN